MHAALERIADPDLRQFAQAALESLCWDVLAVSEVSQLDLQTFLWRDLSRRWVMPDPELRQVPEGFARLFDELDLPRYARICRSATTKRMLDAWRSSSPDAAHRSFVAALDRSGVLPPDTERLQWSNLLGPVESLAYSESSRVLEVAIACRDLLPSSGRWRSDQRAIIDGWLETNDDRHFDGATPRAAIERERLQCWLDARRGSGCAIPATLRTAIVDVLDDDPTDIADDKAAGDAGAESSVAEFEVLRLLVEHAAAPTGLRLTERGRLSRAFVRETAEHLGWFDARIGSVAGEHDVPVLGQVRDLAVAIGVVRKRRTALVATPRGRSSLRSQRDLREITMRQLCVAGDGLECAVTQLVLAFLLIDGACDRDALNARTHRAMFDVGWRSSRVGEDALDPDAVRWWLGARLLLLDALGLVRARGSWPSFSYELTEAGQVSARAGLRACAFGPVRDLRVMPS